MPRFIDPERYNEDWYIELRGEYQKFFDYIIENCDCAGIWKPNRIDFEIKTGFKINLDSFLQRVNGDKERILVLNNGRWFLPGFIKFQYFNKSAAFNLDLSNNLHKGLYKSLESNGIEYSQVWGLIGAKVASKDKDKDKVIKKGGIRGKDDELLHPIENCLEVALKDQRWVKANSANRQRLEKFNTHLVSRGVYEKSYNDYKNHFPNWSDKQDWSGMVKKMVL